MIKVELVHCNSSIEDRTDEGSVRDNPNACIVVAYKVLLKMTEDDSEDAYPAVQHMIENDIDKSQVLFHRDGSFRLSASAQACQTQSTSHVCPSCLDRRSVTSITVHAKCPFTRECILMLLHSSGH